MARLARAVAPGLPHHITQRGNRRQDTFFGVEDYTIYLELMAEWCGRCGVEIWAYCQMPNYVHLIEGHRRTGRPLGGKAFIGSLEAQLGRPLAPAKRGGKSKKN